MENQDNVGASRLSVKLGAWIDAKRDVPKEFCSVIGFLKLPGDEEFESGECYFDGESWNSVRDNGEIEVTHWMPLPEAPN